MLVVISCPRCGHLGRVPEGRIGHKVRCKGCGGTFRPDAALAQPAPESLRKEKDRATAGPSRTPSRSRGQEKPSAEEQPKSRWIGVLTRPAVIDGAISGALGGILTGVLMGAINGGVNHQASAGSVARVIGGGLNGLIVGFLCGAPLGGLLGLLASYLPGAILAASRRRALFTGIIAGAAVTALIARGSPWMIALGILPGALGSGFWSLLQNWEQAADKPFVSGFQVEEEASPEASSPESKEASADDFQSWGAYDDEKT
jgi:hypothetical protein